MNELEWLVCEMSEVLTFVLLIIYKDLCSVKARFYLNRKILIKVSKSEFKGKLVSK